MVIRQRVGRHHADVQQPRLRRIVARELSARGVDECALVFAAACGRRQQRDPRAAVDAVGDDVDARFDRKAIGEQRSDHIGLDRSRTVELLQLPERVVERAPLAGAQAAFQIDLAGHRRDAHLVDRLAWQWLRDGGAGTQVDRGARFVR